MTDNGTKTRALKLATGLVLGGLSLPALNSAAQAGDPAAGKAVFMSTCSICHSAQPGKNSVGPSLFGIVGRKTGEGAGFHYSQADMAANIVWDAATLDKYLQAPRETIPGTTMTYAGLKDETKRGDLIAYLATLK